MSYNCPLGIDLIEEDEEFLKVLKESAATADTVELYCSYVDTEGHKSRDEIIRRFELIATRLTQMTKATLTVQHSRYHESVTGVAVIPVKALQKILQLRRDNLEHLQILWKIQLVGTRQDFDEALKALAQCKNLRTFHMESLAAEEEEAEAEEVSEVLPANNTTTTAAAASTTATSNTQLTPPATRDSRAILGSLLLALNKLPALEEMIVHDVELYAATVDSPLAKLCKISDPINTPNIHNDTIEQQQRAELSLNLSGLDIIGSIIQLSFSDQSRLVNLDLVDAPDMDQNVSALAHALRTNQIIKRIQLSCSSNDINITVKSSIELLQNLQFNHVLEALKMDITYWSDDEKFYGEELARAVSKTCHLKDLSLDIYDKDNTRRQVDAVLGLVKGLQDNCSLTQFELSLCDDSGDLRHDDLSDSDEDDDDEEQEQEERDAHEGIADRQQKPKEVVPKAKADLCIIEQLSNTLRHNHLLQEVELYRNNFELIEPTEEINFWLKLNNLGRYKIERNPDRRDLWVNTVIAQNDDPSTTFYFLRANPALWLVSKGDEAHNFAISPRKKQKRIEQDNI